MPNLIKGLEVRTNRSRNSVEIVVVQAISTKTVEKKLNAFIVKSRASPASYNNHRQYDCSAIKEKVRIQSTQQRTSPRMSRLPNQSPSSQSLPDASWSWKIHLCWWTSRKGGATSWL